MKVAGAVLVLVIASALLYWSRLRPAVLPPSTQSPVAVGSASSPQAPVLTKAKVVDKVRHITKDERTELAKQIESARAKRQQKLTDAEGHDNLKKPDPVPELPESSETIVKTTMRAAMQEVIPMLSDCYDKGGSNLPTAMDVVAELTLTGDPDIGTIVDANSLKNKDGSPVNEAFGTCVQDTLVTLEMPPISEGDVVNVTYPFAFARDDSTMPP